MRGRFFWRLGLFFGFAFLLVLGATIIAPRIIGRPPGALVLLAAVFLVMLAVGRGVRRMAAPIGDVMDAAQRVAEGDYSVHVPERGPPEVRQLTRAFNTMVSRLRATDERRRSLLADISHDLRTPLAVIQGNLEGLLDGVYPRDDAHLGPVLDETRLLARLVGDLRTLALAETGALRLEREPTDLGALVTETAASFQGQADDASVLLSVDVAPGLPPVYVDAFRIREVLENLVVNALQHTPRGREIRITCALGSAPDNDRRFILSISDTGMGISPEDLPHVFDRFYKSRDSRGSGLGLAIAKNLVAAHGGDISVESELGRGTTMRVSLPVNSEAPRLP